MLGDLNIVRDNTQLQNFCESFLFEDLTKKPTCYKGDTPTGTDHIITNIPKRFMKSMALETGISDHHKMIMTIFRSTFAKGKPKTFYYRCYKKSNLEQFQMELKEKLGDFVGPNFFSWVFRESKVFSRGYKISSRVGNVVNFSCCPHEKQWHRNISQTVYSIPNRFQQL